MTRNRVHPAKRARTFVGLASLASFMTVVSSISWNAQQAELDLANSALESPTLVIDPTVIPVPTDSAAPAVESSASATPVTQESVAPAPTASKAPKKSAAPATPAKKKVKKDPPKTDKKTSAPTPSQPAKTTAPSAPAKQVVYTCMSPDGNMEPPTSKGKCKNAKYGYVLTKVRSP